MHESMEDPYSEDKRRRAERRWKRKERIWNDDSKHKRIASGRRINVKSCGNMPFLIDNDSHIVEDEVDEDYKMFLDTYVHQFDVENNRNDGVSNFDADTVYSSDSGDDLDPQYKTFLENLRKEGNSYVASVTVHNRIEYKRYEEEEEEDDENEKETSDTLEYQQSLETQGKPCDKKIGSNVPGVPKNNCNTELLFDDTDKDHQRLLKSLLIIDKGLMPAQVGSDYNRRSSSRDSLPVSNQAFITPEVYDIDEEEQAGDTVKSQPNLKIEREPFDKKPCSDLPKNSENTELELDNVDEEYQIFLNSLRTDDGDDLDIHSADEDYQRFLDSYMTDDDCLDFAKVEIDFKGKNSSVRYNSQGSDQEFDNPKSQCDNDGPFLNFSGVTDGNLMHTRDRNIGKTHKGIRDTYKGDGDSSSSEPDLILLERNQIGENTPFVFSRIYDSSCFENETNPRDCRHFSSNNHSEFRRRLMKDLERPYDQEEYDQFLDEVNLQRKKERHVETRRGVVKSYHTHGVNKSYLESYPDLDKAIAKFKEPHKVLFLLRGFFFWLQNMTHEGIFQPWTDKSCLEILQKI